MVRRAILDRGDELADDEALPLSQAAAARPGQDRARWPGAGGRWLVWVARAVAWAVLILVGYRGVLAIIQGQGTGAPASSSSAAGGTRFPVTLAEAYAQQFGTVYLNFSPATASQRGRELARFLPRGADAQLGWNGAGVQRLQSEQVAGVTVTSRHTAVVMLLAQLGDGRVLELGVPIYAAHGAMTVSGDPALLPGPAKASPPPAQLTSDQATETALQNQLPAFFRAYGSGDRTTLARFDAPGTHIVGLGGAVRFAAIDNVYAPAGDNRRQIAVTVTWDLPVGSSARSASIASAPSALQMTYQMTVVRQAATWDVQAIGASAQSYGPP
ncbi:MAG: conjugal transfer protein [Streptosporangiaceae bacterium]